MTPGPSPVRYVTGYGSRTHIANGEQVVVESRYRHERYWNTLCGVTADEEQPYPTARWPLCKHCERVAAKATAS